MSDIIETEVESLRLTVARLKEEVARLDAAYVNKDVEPCIQCEVLQHKAERQRDDLLARIHRDGGHYTEEHGVEKSCKDADLRVAEAYGQCDMLDGIVDDLLAFGWVIADPWDAKWADTNCMEVVDAGPMCPVCGQCAPKGDKWPPGVTMYDPANHADDCRLAAVLKAKLGEVAK